MVETVYRVPRQAYICFIPMLLFFIDKAIGKVLFSEQVKWQLARILSK